MIRKLDFQDIQYINIFEKVSKVRSQDCFNYGSYIIFVVPQGEQSKAIGHGGINAKRLSDILKKKVKIISYNGNKEDFVKAILYPIRFKEVKIEGNQLSIKAGFQSKALIIGRNSARLKELKETLERYFKIDMIRII